LEGEKKKAGAKQCRKGKNKKGWTTAKGASLEYLGFEGRRTRGGNQGRRGVK